MADLGGLGILVTRPAHQAEPLCELIEAAGGKAIRFPVLEIVDPENISPVVEIIKGLDVYDLAIFISPNAVNKAMNLIHTHATLPENMQIAAVGKSSARALQKLGHRVDLFPEKRFNSEALLEMAELQHVKGKKIIIFRGDGGRELLADTLRQRGAEVVYANCYRRIRPKSNVSRLLKSWARGDVDLITVTSNEGLHNLYEMVGGLGREWLKKTPILVISERLRAYAKELGFVHEPILAESPSDAAIMQAMVNWLQNR